MLASQSKRRPHATKTAMSVRIELDGRPTPRRALALKSRHKKKSADVSDAELTAGVVLVVFRGVLLPHLWVAGLRV